MLSLITNFDWTAVCSQNPNHYYKKQGKDLAAVIVAEDSALSAEEESMAGARSLRAICHIGAFTEERKNQPEDGLAYGDASEPWPEVWAEERPAGSSASQPWPGKRGGRGER